MNELELFRQSLRNIAYDVFHLEINTILKDSMTAQKMPPSPHAVLDIAADYVRFLRRLDVAVCRRTLAALEPARRTTSHRTFEALKGIAGHILAQAGALGVSAHDQVIVERIYRNSAHLVTILEPLCGDVGPGEPLAADACAGVFVPPPPDNQNVWNTNREGLYRLREGIQEQTLAPQDRVIIRKMWEVGTERVVMQSVIQLDGDVVTRVQDDRAGTDAATLHALHQQAVATSIETWQMLVQTLGALIGGLRSFFPRLLGGPG